MIANLPAGVSCQPPDSHALTFIPQVLALPWSEATQQTAFRLPIRCWRGCAYAARLRGEQPGLNITRADVVRLLLTRALDEAGVASTPGKRSSSTPLTPGVVTTYHLCHNSGGRS
jgi:hypothetical protein